MLRKDVLSAFGWLAASTATGRAAVVSSARGATRLGETLSVPPGGVPLVAFLIGPDLVPIDLFGPHAVLLDAAMGTADMRPMFAITTVAETTDAIDIGGMKLQPRHTIPDDVRPNVLIVPAQRSTPAIIDYIRRASKHADVTASICTGAFLVAKAGLFDGGRATTHHSAYDAFQRMFPKVTLLRGPRYVEDPLVSSSGGETCGIDLTLRIVERYYGPDVARAAAFNMEYRRTARPVSERDT